MASAAQVANVGVLDVAYRQREADAAVGPGAIGDDNESDIVNDEPTCRLEVHYSLCGVEFPRYFCASDKADGTTLTTALPTTLGLRVNSTSSPEKMARQEAEIESKYAQGRG